MKTKKLMDALIIAWAIGFVSIFCYGMAKAESKGNVKYEATEDRVVVSCLDGKNPILRTAPRPTGGYYAVVVCEKEGRQ